MHVRTACYDTPIHHRGPVSHQTTMMGAAHQPADSAPQLIKSHLLGDAEQRGHAWQHVQNPTVDALRFWSSTTLLAQDARAPREFVLSCRVGPALENSAPLQPNIMESAAQRWTSQVTPTTTRLHGQQPAVQSGR